MYDSDSVVCPSTDTLYLRMVRITDDDDMRPFGACLLNNIVYLFHKRTGCVNDTDIFFLQFIVDAFLDTVRTDDDCPLAKSVQFLL